MLGLKRRRGLAGADKPEEILEGVSLTTNQQVNAVNYALGRDSSPQHSQEYLVREAEEELTREGIGLSTAEPKPSLENNVNCGNSELEGLLKEIRTLPSGTKARLIDAVVAENYGQTLTSDESRELIHYDEVASTFGELEKQVKPFISEIKMYNINTYFINGSLNNLESLENAGICSKANFVNYSKSMAAVDEVLGRKKYGTIEEFNESKYSLPTLFGSFGLVVPMFTTLGTLYGNLNGVIGPVFFGLLGGVVVSLPLALGVDALVSKGKINTTLDYYTAVVDYAKQVDQNKLVKDKAVALHYAQELREELKSPKSIDGKKRKKYFALDDKRKRSIYELGQVIRFLEK